MTTDEDHGSKSVAAFLGGCQLAHDADPAEWHRGMLTPPGRPRTDRCGFCGIPWAEVNPSACPIPPS